MAGVDFAVPRSTVHRQVLWQGYRTNGKKKKSQSCIPVPMRLVVQQGKVEQIVEVPQGSSPMVVLDLLRLPPDAFIVLRGRAPIPLDERLSDGESITLIKVASGG